MGMVDSLVPDAHLDSSLASVMPGPGEGDGPLG